MKKITPLNHTLLSKILGVEVFLNLGLFIYLRSILLLNMGVGWAGLGGGGCGA